jgi:WD40 repeat protein
VLATVRREKGPGFVKQWQSDTLAFSWSTTPTSSVPPASNGRATAGCSRSRSTAARCCGAAHTAEEAAGPSGAPTSCPCARVAFAPSSDRFATLDETGDLRIWRAADGLSLLEVRAHESKGKALAWSPDGRLLATGGCDQSWAETSVRLYDAESGARLGEVRTRSWVITLAFSPDSRRLCYCGGDAYVRLLDVRSCEPVLSIKTDNVVTKLAFSADGRYLAAGDTAGAIQLGGPESAEGCPLALTSSIVRSSVASAHRDEDATILRSNECQPCATRSSAVRQERTDSSAPSGG